MLKKILIGVFALIVLLVAAIAIGPRFVNWNSYKGKVAEQVRAATGRDLAIDGDMSLSLLPSPALSVSGVRLANLPGGSAPDMARLKSLDVHVALVPLLSGKIQVTSVTLVEPVVLLERLPNGEANWQFTPPAATGTSSAAAGSGSPAGNAPSGPAAEISVDNFTIENGTVLYRAGGIEQKLEGLDATVVMRSLSGPFTATGQAKLVGLPAKFDIAVDSLAGSGPIPMRGTLNVAGDAVVVSFDGSADQTAAAVKGKIGAKLSDPALVFKSAGFQNLPAGLAQPFTLSADLDASAASIALANLALSLGDTNATGKIDFQPGSPTQGSINLAFSRLDLDKLLPAATSAPSATTAAPAPATTVVPGSGGFALPGQVVVNFDLSAEAVAWHQGVVTRPHLTGRLADGQLQIKQASALLPGGSDVSLAGTIASKDGMPQFAGAIQAKSDNLRDLANWLGAPLPKVSADRLRSLTLTSRLIAGPTQIEVADLDMRLDASHIQGGVTVALPGGARTKPAFGIGLTIDQLDADAYMPPKGPGGASTASAGTTGNAGAAGKPASPLAGLSPLADLEANFDLRAGTLSYNGQAMRGLHLQGTLFGGKLTIADASAKDIGGGQGSMAGSIVNLAKDPRYDLKVNVAAQDAARVLQIAGFGRPAPGQYGALKLNGAVKGGADDVAFDISFAVTGPGIEGAANGTAQGLRAGVPRVDSTLSLAAKNAAPVFQMLGFSRPGVDKLGAVALTGKATSGKDSLDFDLALNLPGIGGKGTLMGRLTGLSATPQVATDLKLDAAQPAPLLALAGVGGATASKLGALGVAGHLEGSANAMKLALTLTALGGNASINGSVAAAKAPIAFDVTLSANHGDFGSLLAALGKPAPRNAGPLALTVHLSGDAGKFSVKDLSLKAGDSDLSGNATVDMSGSRLQFAASLASNNFNAAALSAGSGGGSSSGGAGSGSAATQGGGRWSRQPLDLSALDMGDGTLDYKAGRLQLTGNRIDDLVARFQFAGGTMTIQTLTGKIYGGTFAVSDAKVIGRGLPAFSGRVLAQNMEIAQLAGSDTVKGPLSISAGIAASGASEAEMIGSLQGSGHLAGKIQILSKLTQTAGTALLGALGSQLKIVQGITDRLGGVLQLFAGKVNDLAGDFSINHGVVATENTTLTNPAAKALAHGTANLPLWKMAMIVDVYRAPDMKNSIMTINLAGPLDKPNVNLTGPLFQPGSLSNPLQQLIPGLQPQQPAPNSGNTPQNQPQQQTQPQANDPLQQLLNGLEQPQQQQQQQPQQQKPPPQPANPLAPILQNLLGQPQGN
jgi:uncharacterized protein involved in outer membrane biogenesis